MRTDIHLYAAAKAAAAPQASFVSATAAAKLAQAAAERAAQPHGLWHDADLVFSAPLAEGYERDCHPVIVALLARLGAGLSPVASPAAIASCKPPQVRQLCPRDALEVRACPPSSKL